MNILKKFAGLMVVCSLVTPYTVLAQTKTEYETMELSSDSRIGNGSREISLFSSPSSVTADEAELLEYIASQFSQRATEINIEAYNVSVYRFREIYSYNMGHILRDKHPEIFYMEKCSITMQTVRYGNEPDIVCKVIPEYDYEDDVIESKQAVIDAEVDYILSLMNDNMTDLEKALFVHDYIASNYHYDLRAYSTNPQIADQCNHYIDGMVAEKTGVCQGYTNLYMYVLDKCGIECETVPSDICNHIWNKVYIDGRWLNVDVTYDDAIPDRSTNISHDYFLVTDDRLKELDPSTLREYGYEQSCHYTWNTTTWDGQEATISDTDDSAYYNFRQISGATIYKDNEFYAIDSVNNICKLVFNNENIVRPMNPLSAAFGWKYYGYFSALALLGDNIYINDGNSVYRYDIDANRLDTVYSYSEDTSRYNSHLYGLQVIDGTLYAEYTEDLNEGTSLIPIEISETPDDPKPDDPDPEPLPEMTKVEEVIDAEEPTIVISVEIPEEIKEEQIETIKIMVAQYDDAGVLVGFSQVEKEKLKEEVVLNDNCSSVKTFVWSEDNTPLSIVSEFLRQLTN